MNINKLMQMQNKLTKAMKEFEQQKFTYTKNSITIVIDGKLKIEKITFNDQEIINPEDPNTLEDLLIVAINHAIKDVTRLKEEKQQKIGSSMSGMGGLF